jgi:hypothetical protein
MIPAESIPGTGGGEIKEGVNSSMIYLIHCKNLCNATVYPHPA